MGKGNLHPHANQDSLSDEINVPEEAVEDDDSPDPVLRERYLRMKAEMKTGNHAEMLKKLRSSSILDD